jgi:acyl-CoA thioesterase-1
VQGRYFANWAAWPIAVATLIAGFALPLSARAETAAPACDAPIDLVRLVHPLSRMARKLATNQPVTIVAIGSSSTAGAGASSPTANYPNRLAAELKQLLPKQPIVVINRGVNGEEVGDMLKRFDSAIIEAKPDLVLWQLGTNSVIRDHMFTDFTDRGESIRSGLKIIRAVGADVVLIDPQFAPKVIVKPEAEKMVDLIATTAKLEDVDLFRRFGLMRHWNVDDKMPFESFVAPDGLHMNDWSYACMAKGLALAITEAAQRPVVSATAVSHMVP